MFTGIVSALGKVKLIEKNDIYNVALHLEKVYLTYWTILKKRMQLILIKKICI